MEPAPHALASSARGQYLRIDVVTTHRRNLPVLVATVAVACALTAAWFWLGQAEARQSAERTERDARQASLRLSDFVTARLVAVESIRRIREAGLMGEEATFVRSATIVQNELGGYLAINWIAPDGTIVWVSPAERNAAARGRNVFRHPQASPAAREAERTRRPSATPPIPLFQGIAGFAPYYPVLVEGELIGFVNGVFDIRGLVEASLEEGILEAHELRITTDEGALVHETPGFADAAAERPVGRGDMDVVGGRWQLALAQNDATAHVSMARHVFLAVGLLLTLLCAALGVRILSRRERQQQLEREQRELAELVAASRDPHALLDRDGAAIRANDAAQFWLEGKARCGDHVDDRDAWQAALAGAFAGTPQRLELRLGPDAAQYDVSLQPLGDDSRAVALHAKDDRERRRLEDDLRRAQKLEAIGRLAGGIAHDFNNLLTAVTGLATVARSDPRLPEELAEDMDAIVGAAERGSDLTRKLLAFARTDPAEPDRVVDLGEQIRGLRRLLRQLVREDVSLSVSCPSTPLWVSIAPSQLEQIALNLVVNSIDAIEGHGHVDVRVEPAGDGVALIVEDDGAGMTEDVRERVFEPFFTTKAPGKGTGLGLASVYGIARARGGSVTIDSAPGEGTRVQVSFPRVEAPPTVAPTPSITPEPREHGALVLLAEDEPSVRATTSRILRLAGFEVLEAENGRVALDLLERSSKPPDVLVSDVIMPEMRGPELALAVRERCPDIGIVLCSGYVGDALEGPEFETLGAELVAKPYRPSELLDAIERVRPPATGAVASA